MFFGRFLAVKTTLPRIVDVMKNQNGVRTALNNVTLVRPVICHSIYHCALPLEYIEAECVTVKVCTHGAICIRVQILHICIYAKFAYVCKSLHVYAFTHVCKICTYAKVGKFAPASDQVQISFCVYANFAYMQIWSCERKAKFAHVSIYLIVLNKS